MTDPTAGEGRPLTDEELRKAHRTALGGPTDVWAIRIINSHLVANATIDALLSQLREQRERAERAEALVRAKQSWIDGMKVDYDALNDEANDHAHAAAIAEARAERAEGVVQAAKSVERASHISERAITNAMAGLRVRLDAYNRED